MGKYFEYRGSLTEADFIRLVGKTRMIQSTIDDLRRYFVDGEIASSINRKQLMSNRIARIVKEIQLEQAAE